MEATKNNLTVNRGKPPLPKGAFKIVNPVIKSILRSPFHKIISGNFIVLTFKGRRTGKQVSTPVGYTRKSNSLIVFTFSSWWKNLKENPEVSILLQGRDVKGKIEIITDLNKVAQAVNLILDTRGDEMGKRLGFERISPEASAEEIREKSQHLVFLQIDMRG